MTLQNLAVSLALVFAIALDTAAKYVPDQGKLPLPLIMSIAAGVLGLVTLGRPVYWENTRRSFWSACLTYWPLCALAYFFDWKGLKPVFTFISIVVLILSISVVALLIRDFIEWLLKEPEKAKPPQTSYTLTGLTGLVPSDKGRPLLISGAVTDVNNNRHQVEEVLSSTSVRIDARQLAAGIRTPEVPPVETPLEVSGTPPKSRFDLIDDL
jgi:hypothetical protein